MAIGGKIKLEEGTGGGTMVGFKAPDTEVTDECIWTLPSTDGIDGQSLVTDGSKNLRWADAGATGIQGADGHQGLTGETGISGLPFNIAKTYASVIDLEADTEPAGIVTGEFAVINSADGTADPDHGKLYRYAVAPLIPVEFPAASQVKAMGLSVAGFYTFFSTGTLPTGVEPGVSYYVDPSMGWVMITSMGPGITYVDSGTGSMTAQLSSPWTLVLDIAGADGAVATGPQGDTGATGTWDSNGVTTDKIADGAVTSNKLQKGVAASSRFTFPSDCSGLLGTGTVLTVFLTSVTEGVDWTATSSRTDTIQSVINAFFAKGSPCVFTAGMFPFAGTLFVEWPSVGSDGNGMEVSSSNPLITVSDPVTSGGTNYSVTYEHIQDGTITVNKLRAAAGINGQVLTKKSSEEFEWVTSSLPSTASVTLSHDDIVAGGSTELVAAPASGQYHHILSAETFLNFNSEAYPPSLAYSLSDGSVDINISSGFKGSASLNKRYYPSTAEVTLTTSPITLAQTSGPSGLLPISGSPLVCGYGQHNGTNGRDAMAQDSLGNIYVLILAADSAYLYVKKYTVATSSWSTLHTVDVNAGSGGTDAYASLKVSPSGTCLALLWQSGSGSSYFVTTSSDGGSVWTDSSAAFVTIPTNGQFLASFGSDELLYLIDKSTYYFYSYDCSTAAEVLVDSSLPTIPNFYRVSDLFGGTNVVITLGRSPSTYLDYRVYRWSGSWAAIGPAAFNGNNALIYGGATVLPLSGHPALASNFWGSAVISIWNGTLWVNQSVAQANPNCLFGIAADANDTVHCLLKANAPLNENRVYSLAAPYSVGSVVLLSSLTPSSPAGAISGPVPSAVDFYQGGYQFDRAHVYQLGSAGDSQVSVRVTYETQEILV